MLKRDLWPAEMSGVVVHALSLPYPAPREGGVLRQSDERLARRAARGDREAFAVLYLRHHDGLSRVCRAVAGSEEDGADALQNAAIQAWRSISDLREPTAVRGWLYRIAHREALAIRATTGTARVELPEELADRRGGPEILAADRERLRELLEDVQALPARQRGALVLRELSGLDYPTIAAALECSPAAAKQAVHEARLALHDSRLGRGMECEPIRSAIAQRDGRRLRGRRLRAHLRSCTDCEAFALATARRPADLALLFPPLPAPPLLAAFVTGDGDGGGPGQVVGPLRPRRVAVGAAVAGAALAATAFAISTSGEASNPAEAVAAIPEPAASPSGAGRAVAELARGAGDRGGSPPSAQGSSSPAVPAPTLRPAVLGTPAPPPVPGAGGDGGRDAVVPPVPLPSGRDGTDDPASTPPSRVIATRPSLPVDDGATPAPDGAVFTPSPVPGDLTPPPAPRPVTPPPGPVDPPPGPVDPPPGPVDPPPGPVDPPPGPVDPPPGPVDPPVDPPPAP